MPYLIDMRGYKIGKLLVVEATRNDKGKMMWKCKCECGNETLISGENLRSNEIKSCGCSRYDGIIKHGQYKSLTYKIWNSMIQRCTNPNMKNFSRYGGRGITICDRWFSFDNFYTDMGDKPDGYSIERIDNNKGYSPDNCRWATRLEQSRNREVYSTSTTGYAGVSFHKATQKWRARIVVKQKEISLGTYLKIEDAIKARKEAEKNYWSS